MYLRRLDVLWFGWFGNFLIISFNKVAFKFRSNESASLVGKDIRVCVHTYCLCDAAVITVHLRGVNGVYFLKKINRISSCVQCGGLLL